MCLFFPFHFVYIRIIIILHIIITFIWILIYLSTYLSSCTLASCNLYLSIIVSTRINDEKFDLDFSFKIMR